MSPSSLTPRSSGRSLRRDRNAVLRRARARRQSAGAVLFIVVITLGLLAAMGVYGMSSAASDIRASAHMRDALQGQMAGQHALTMTAETLNPATAQAIVQNMSDPTRRTTNCQTATFQAGTDAVAATSACLRLSEAEMKNAIKSVDSNAFGGSGTGPGFANDSFGGLNTKPYVEVELSNPLDVPPAPGSGYDPNLIKFTQVTATVFVNVRTAPTSAAQAVVAGRGRLTVGPVQGRPPAY